MDRIVRKIYDYSRKVMASPLEKQVSEEIKKRIADAIIVAYGAKDAEPVVIERNTLLPSKGRMNSSMFFVKDKASIDVASFINGSMVRYIDYNDTYLSKEALHPSDNIPPVLAVSEALELSGSDAMKGIAVAYQTVCSLADAVSIRDRGWDHVTYISASSAAGIAAVSGLDETKFENTVSLGINNNISMRQTRAGELSMWKGCTAANAGRNSVFSYLIANGGFSGPSNIFDGEMGFFRQVSGNFDLDIEKDRILKTMIKNYPVEYHAMSAAEETIAIRPKINGEIKKIQVETFEVAHKIIIKDPEKLRPKTKETADHSMPYIIAYCLVHGAPTPDAYSARFLNDRKILSLIDLMEFKVTDRYNKMYPESLPFGITITTDSGTVSGEMNAPKGHHKNPYSWDDVYAKGARVMGPDKSKELIDTVRSLEKRSVADLMEATYSVTA